MVVRLSALTTVIIVVGCSDKSPDHTAGAAVTAPTASALALTIEAAMAAIPPHVVEAARRAAGMPDLITSGKIEPEVAGFNESPDGWRVRFRYRVTITEVDGQRVVRAQDPAQLTVEVRRNDLTARIVPGR